MAAIIRQDGNRQSPVSTASAMFISLGLIKASVVQVVLYIVILLLGVINGIWFGQESLPDVAWIEVFLGPLGGTALLAVIVWYLVKRDAKREAKYDAAQDARLEEKDDIIEEQRSELKELRRNLGEKK